jgi:hypothetical protein
MAYVNVLYGFEICDGVAYVVSFDCCNRIRSRKKVDPDNHNLGPNEYVDYIQIYSGEEYVQETEALADVLKEM